MGVSQNNLEEALKTDTENVCGITDDGLYFNNEESILANYPDFLERLFSKTETLVALHCEDDSIIKKNTAKYQSEFGDKIPVHLHSEIRDEQACLQASKRVLEIANKNNNRLHLLHISTLAEANLLDNKIPIRQKRITAEACVHHLWFSDNDYKRLGNKIKWNPSIKTEADKIGLLQSLLNNKLDNIATDHAPHLLSEKEDNYFQAKCGAPLVQHALPILLELYHHGKISLEKIIEKTSHHVAEIYRIKERGYIREGYYADLVLLDINNPWQVNSTNLLYKCKWSPFNNYQFKSKVMQTFVNGQQVYNNGNFNETNKGNRLKFEKIR
jgi:dihydroorotase